MIIDKLHPILRRFRAPAGEGADLGGGGEDRGDDFTPTDDDGDAGKDVKNDKDTDDGDKGDEKDPKGAKAEKDGEGGEKDDPKGDEKDEKDDKKDGKDRKDTRIPVSRHKEILQKERERADALERQLAAYQGGDRVAATNDQIKKIEDKIEAIDKEYTKLVTDGEHEKAAEKRRELRRLENEAVELKSDLKAHAATARAVEKMRYDTTVERLEAAYPILDPEHDDHDPDKTQDVLDLAQTYRGRGLTPAEAIQKAAKTLLGAETKKQTDAVNVKARVSEEEAEEAAREEAAREKKEAERKKAQVQKNLEADKKQPADTSKRGADSDKAGGGITAKDVLKMSQEDFNKLDEETLARMRGDVIA